MEEDGINTVLPAHHLLYLTGSGSIMMKTLYLILLFCLLLPLLSGCTTTAPEAPEPAPIVTLTPVPVTPPESPVIITPPEFSRVRISLDANPLQTDPALLLTLEMDARTSSGTIPREGYSVTMTFFAYNVDAAPAGFLPETADDIRASGLPYKTRTMLIYQDNIITHREQVPEMGSPTGIFNPDTPYIYGVIIEMRGD